MTCRGDIAIRNFTNKRSVVNIFIYIHWCLMKLLGVTLRDRRRNIDIMRELGIVRDIVQVIQLRRLTYFGQVVRMDNVHCASSMHRIARAYKRSQTTRKTDEELDWQYCERLSANKHIHTWSQETGLRQTQMVVYGAQPGLSARVDFVVVAKTLKKDWCHILLFAMYTRKPS